MLPQLPRELWIDILEKKKSNFFEDIPECKFCETKCVCSYCPNQLSLYKKEICLLCLPKVWRCSSCQLESIELDFVECVICKEYSCADCLLTGIMLHHSDFHCLHCVEERFTNPLTPEDFYTLENIPEDFSSTEDWNDSFTE